MPGYLVMEEKELRRLLDRIELKYFHKKLAPSRDSLTTDNKPRIIKLSAAQKYVEVSHELVQLTIKTSGTLDFNDLDLVFGLIVKPVSSILSHWQQKKDPDALDIFFLKTIELFREAAAFIEDHSLRRKAQLMCIDVHKLRILALKEEEGTVNFATNYIETCLQECPSDGRLWFQHVIIKFSFSPDCAIIRDFRSIDSVCRSILARDYPVDLKNIIVLLDRKIKIDFSNTLLNLALKDFKDFVEKDLQTWSFVKYFQSFLAAGSEHLKLSELAAIFLFVLAFFRASKNSFHFKIFLESCLTAPNQSISEFWPFYLFCTLKLVRLGELELSDAIWFKIFQLLKTEGHILSTVSLNNSDKYTNFLAGTYLIDKAGFENDYLNFDEDFSIERDSIIADIVEYFHHERGPFNQFITLRSDRSLRLGSHFCAQETESEDEREVQCIKEEAAMRLGSKESDLDDSIEQLRSKLANLANSESLVKKLHEIDYLNSQFILDTNVLLSGHQQLKIELLDRPHLFLIPLVVLHEISRLRECTEKSTYACAAWDLLTSCSNLNIYNNYGRLLRAEEIKQQLSILSLTRTHGINDDQIIELASQFPDNVDAPILVTEDVNMRLKAKMIVLQFQDKLANSAIDYPFNRTQQMIPRFKPKIGVEIHAQLLTDLKIFSDAKVDWKAPVNSQVALFDSATPGSLPVLNRHCVTLALRAAKATGCTVARRLLFDRKHYEHWDLPAGYQITQKREPIGVNGRIDLLPGRTIAIKQIHLEQDSGKSYSNGSSLLVDLNRAGVGLIELVSEPELASPSEAALFVQKCHEIFQDLKICSGNLEHGAMRIDVNVNLVDQGTGNPLTPRVELKNINGIHVIQSAVFAELRRQQKLLEDGNIIPSQEETRLYSPEKDETILLRIKDSSASYRYLPEYDLPPFDLDSFQSNTTTNHLLMTRHERIKLFQHEYPQLSDLGDILLRLWTRPTILPYLFESSLKFSSDPRFLLNWCVGELLAILNQPELVDVECKISGEMLAGLADAVKNGQIDKEIAKTEMFNAINESRDFEKLDINSNPSDPITEPLNQAIDELFQSYPDRVNFLKSVEGQKRGSVDFFIGPLLKKFRGKTSAKELAVILREKLRN